MIRFRHWLVVLSMGAACALSIPLPAAAQAAQNGRILGRVMDAESGRPLPGAQLSVQGTRAGSLAGVDGRYVIVNVPSGEQTLVVSFIGYAPKSVTGIAVPADGAVSLDVTLNSAAVALEGITVSAERERGTVGRALDEQRRATGVVSAISAEQISRTPDGDAAQAVQRVSGVTVQDGKYVFVRGLGERYTTTSLNGARMPSPEPEKKMVPLDLFPAGLLQSITTSKTFTPNLAGDFSGAQVDIRTREFPSSRRVAYSYSLGYNPGVASKTLLRPRSSGREWLAMSAGARDVPQPAREIETGMRPGTETNRVINSFRNAWAPTEGLGRPSSSASASIGGSDPVLGRTVGYLLSGSYSYAEETSADQRRARWFPGTEGGDVEWQRFDGTTGRSSVLWGGLLNLSTMFGPNARVALNNMYNRTADNEARREQGVDENTASRVQIDRLQYVERSLRSNQLVSEHQLNSRARLDWAVTSSGVSRKEPDRSEFVTLLPASGTPIWFDDPEGAVRTFGDVSESSFEGKTDYRLDMGSPTRRHQISIGALYRYTDRNADSRGYQIRPRNWTFTDERWMQSPEVIFDGRNAQGDDANFLLQTTRSGGGYSATDHLVAGYGMIEFAATDRLRFVGGARVEHSNVALTAENMQAQRTRSTPTYTDVLPSAALNIRVTDRQTVRLSASRTLARPEYRELAAISYREVLGGEQVIGNPALRRTLIRNLDARWEWYPNPSEVVSLALFAKHFKDPIEQRYLGRSGTDTRSFFNAESAENYGVEVELRKGLGFLGGLLDPIHFFTNATVMDSRVVYGDVTEDRAMVGQAPYVLNTGLTYAAPGGGMSATVLYNVVGRRVVNVRPSGEQIPDVFEMPGHAFDIALRFPLLSRMSMKLDAKNLLDSPYEVMQGTVTREYHRPGRSFAVGVTYTP